MPKTQSTIHDWLNALRGRTRWARPAPLQGTPMSHRSYLVTPGLADGAPMLKNDGDSAGAGVAAQSRAGFALQFEGKVTAVDRDGLGVVVSITTPEARLDQQGTQKLTMKVLARLKRGSHVRGLVLPGSRGYARITSLELA